jgi:myosin heavy subunit
VLEQLRYSGALEVVRIRREGYPVNFSFCDFYYEYELLTDRLKNISDDNIKRTAIKIANKYLNNEEYQIGYERIFLRSSYEESMSQVLIISITIITIFIIITIKKAMKKMFNKTATLIQTRARIIIAKNLSKKTQISFFFIQRLLRGHRARKRYN